MNSPSIPEKPKPKPKSSRTFLFAVLLLLLAIAVVVYKIQSPGKDSGKPSANSASGGTGTPKASKLRTTSGVELGTLGNSGNRKPRPTSEGDSEKEAISALKAKMEEINNMMKVKRTEENPATQLIGMRSMLGEMDKLPTEGLPTDLKDTVTGLKDFCGRLGKVMLPIFEGIPTEADALKQWGTDSAADPAKLQEVMGKITGLPGYQSLGREGKEKQAAAKTVFEKYGIKALGE